MQTSRRRGRIPGHQGRTPGHLGGILGWISLLIVIGSVAAPGALAVGITLDQEHPTRGEPVIVRVDGIEGLGQLKLEALYRPQSETEVGEVVGDVGADGTIAWTPQVAGLARLGVSTEADSLISSRNVAVKFDRIPLLGMLMFLGAGILLFGGTSVMLRRALER